jgi:hypothetical protein
MKNRLTCLSWIMVLLIVDAILFYLAYKGFTWATGI